MTRNPDERDDVLSANLDRLLEQGGPAEPMPDEVKARIRAGLEREAARYRRRDARVARLRSWVSPADLPLTDRRRVLAGTAAVAVVVTLVVLWPRGTTRAATWRDVAAQLNAAHSVITYSKITQTMADGQRSCVLTRAAFLDPGRSRTETYRPPAGCDAEWSDANASGADLTMVVISAEGGSTLRFTWLWPRERRARIERTAFSAPVEEYREQNSADAAWRRLASVAEEATRTLGVRSFGNRGLLGFEVPFGTLFEGWRDVTGSASVWVEPTTGAPARVEVEFELPSGPLRSVATTVFRFDWNAPIPEEWFNLDPPEGWTVEGRSDQTGARVDPSRGTAAPQPDPAAPRR